MFCATGTRHSLRVNPEVLRGIAPLPDLDDVRLVIEPAPGRAPNRFRLKIPFIVQGEAEGVFAITVFAMVLMIVVAAVVVSARAAGVSPPPPPPLRLFLGNAPVIYEVPVVYHVPVPVDEVPVAATALPLPPPPTGGGPPPIYHDSGR
jgi:hypothetical protein